MIELKRSDMVINIFVELVTSSTFFIDLEFWTGNFSSLEKSVGLFRSFRFSIDLIFEQVNSACFIFGWIDAVILTTIKNFVCLGCNYKMDIYYDRNREKAKNTDIIQKVVRQKLENAVILI